jgi:hypothetical protein
MKRFTGDRSFQGFGSMQSALATAGLLHTKKGKARKNTAQKCRGDCNGFVEFLSDGKKSGYCQKCHENMRRWFPGYARHTA